MTAVWKVTVEWTEFGRIETYTATIAADGDIRARSSGPASARATLGRRRFRVLSIVREALLDNARRGGRP